MIRPPATLAVSLLLSAAMTSPAFAQAPIPRTTPSEAAVDAIFSRYDFKSTPGCSVAVIDHGKVLLKKSYGMADISLGVPMTSSHTMWIPYSETRVFVALAVAMLERDGRIGVDEPVRRYLPQLPTYASTVSVRQLLHHTSGLADYGVLAGPGFLLEDRLSEDEMFRILTRWGRLGFAPGHGHTYSNTDYALLKILVEHVSGTSLHDYLESKLFKPLGMAATRIGFNQADASHRHALFHEATDAGYRRVLRYRISPVGGIAVTTSLDDLIRWNAALRDPMGGLSAMLAALEAGAPPKEPLATNEDFAFGVHRRPVEGVPVVAYHGVGEYMYLVHVPDQDLSVATLCNAYAGMWAFGQEVALLYAKSKEPALGSPVVTSIAATPAAPPRMLRPPRAVPLRELQRYVGEYRSADGKGIADVGIAGKSLVITPRVGPKLPALVALGNGQFKTRIDDWTMLVEFEDADGTGMTLSSWDVTNNESGGDTLRRWTPWQPDASTIREYAGIYVGDDVEVTLHVRVEGGRVLMASRGFTESPLVPQDKADRFRLVYSYDAQFERDASGRVSAVVLDAERVKGMRYTRR